LRLCGADGLDESVEALRLWDINSETVNDQSRLDGFWTMEMLTGILGLGRGIGRGRAFQLFLRDCFLGLNFCVCHFV